MGVIGLGSTLIGVVVDIKSNFGFRLCTFLNLSSYEYLMPGDIFSSFWNISLIAPISHNLAFSS
jgi:hypothetical protein